MIASRTTRAVAHSLRLLVVLTVAGSDALAADAIFDPYVEVGGIYNDNYFLARSGTRLQEANGGYVDAGVDLRLESPRTQWRIEPRVRSTAYSSNSDLDSTDYYLTGALNHRGERARGNVLVSLVDEDIVEGNLPDASFDGPILGQGGATDSGRVLGANRRQYLTASPSAAFELSQRLQLTAAAEFLDMSFDREIAGAQVSYRTLGGLLGLGRKFSEASEVTLGVGYSQFDPDVGGRGSDLQTLRLQWDYRTTERLRTYFRAGTTRTKFDAVGATRARSESGSLFGVGGQWAFLKSDLFVDLQQFVEANGSGFVVERSNLRLQYNHRFTPRVTGFAAVYGIRDQAVGVSRSVYAPRRYVNANIGVEWRVRRTLSLLGRIEHAQQEFSGDARSADGNAVRLAVVYRPRRLD